MEKYKKMTFVLTLNVKALDIKLIIVYVNVLKVIFYHNKLLSFRFNVINVCKIVRNALHYNYVNNARIHLFQY